MSNGFRVEFGVAYDWNKVAVIESRPEVDYFHANARLHEFVYQLPVLTAYKAYKLLLDSYVGHWGVLDWTVRIVDESTGDTVAERFYTWKLEERIGF